MHAILWNIIAYPNDPIAHPYHEIIFAPDCVYNNWYTILYGLPMYLSMTLGIFISGAVWATVALATSVWIPDKLLTVTVPVCIYYLWMCRIFFFLFGWDVPSPSTLYNDALTLKLIWQSLLVNVALFCISTVVYVVGLKRRVQNA